MHRFKTIFIILLLFALLSPIYSFASDSIYVWSNNIVTEENTINELGDAVATDTPPILEGDNQGNILNLESGSAILLEQNSGQILYAHNPHEQLRPASVTKVMSILLIMEAIDSGRLSYTDKISCSNNARSMGGSQIWLNETEQLTVDEMLKAICVVSANDCTVAMAEHLTGSEELFVQQMNQKAKELGMNDTTFKNCHGIDEDGHVTSSYDIALMSRELLLNHPQITKYTTIWMDSLRDGKSELVNTNKLVRNYSGCTGLKTGSTSLSLYNLSATATRNNLSLIAVIMKAPSTAIRFAEAKKILDYGFNTYEYKQFGKKGDTVANVSVQKGISENIDAVFKDDCGILLKKGEDKNITQTMELVESISAPFTPGMKLGTITYSNGNTVILTTEIVTKSEVKKVTFGNVLSEVYKNWFRLNR